MVIIDHISVRNFKNISSADVELGFFNVIVGPNGSGKTNFLKTIPFLNFLINGASDSIADFMSDAYDIKFGFVTPVFNEDCTTEFLLRFSEIETNVTYSYNLKLNYTVLKKSNDYDRRISIQQESLSFKKKSKPGASSIIFNRKKEKIRFGDELTKTAVIDEVSDQTSVIKLLTIIQKKIDKTYSRAIDLLNEILQTEIIYLSNHALKQGDFSLSMKENRLVSFKLTEQIRELENTEKWAIFNEILKYIANIDKVEVNKLSLGSTKRETVYVSVRQFNRVELLDHLSDGTILIIAIVAKVLGSDSNIFFIEEPENSIHPKSLQCLIEFLRTFYKEKQFLISTHSAALLNLVKPEEVIVSHIGQDGLASMSKVDNIKDIRRKLNKGYISFGDLLYQNMELDESYEDEV